MILFPWWWFHTACSVSPLNNAIPWGCDTFRWKAFCVSLLILGMASFHSEMISSPFQLSRVFYLRKYQFCFYFFCVGFFFVVVGLKKKLPKLVERCVPGIQGFLCGAGHSPVAGCVCREQSGLLSWVLLYFESAQLCQQPFYIVASPPLKTSDIHIISEGNYTAAALLS